MNRDALKAFLREARRRKVYTTAVAYAAVSLGLIELGGALLDALQFPDWAPRLLTILLLLAFPVVLVLAWLFDVGGGGVQRTAQPSPAKRDEPPAAPQWSGSFEPSATSPHAAPIELVEEAPAPERVRQAALAFVRHELRTPINAILGYSEMLLEDARDEGDAEAAADLERIHKCGRDVLSFVDGILDMGRISEEQDRDLASYGEQIRADLRDPLGAITGYTEMLIESSREQDRTQRIGDLERMLGAAHRLLELSSDIVAVATQAPDAARANAIRGASLAEGVLSKVRALHNGQEVTERVGSLLVVDDSATNRDLLARQLARKGYVVTTATNGRDALELLGQQEFDLVLLDVLMPELDGVEVLRRMKSDDHLHTIPVIMISALDEIDSIVRCLEMGAADFVSKPFHPTLLDARINATLAVHTARTQPTGPDPRLLRMITATFPEYVVQRIRNGQTELFDGAAGAAVAFVDIDNAVAGSGGPQQRAAAIATLTECVHAAAREQRIGTVVAQHGGIAMVAGFPQPEADAAGRIARAALAVVRDTDAAGMPCRAALHTGAIYAALIGRTSLSYWIWGDGIELARRLAAAGERGRIQVSPACHALLKEHFAIQSRGVVEIAGRGQVKGYVLGAPLAVAAGG